MKRNWMKKAAAGLLTSLLLATPALADTIGGAVVHTDGSGLNLRAGATTDAAVLTEIPNGGFMLVEGKENAWYKVYYAGRCGYVFADYAAFAADQAGDYRFKAATRGTDVNLRSGPGTDSAIVKNITTAGSGLTIVGVNGNWLHVWDESGTEGYIRSDFVDYIDESLVPADTVAAHAAAPAVSDALSLGEQIAATAKQYLGCAYRWGGMSPSTGFDCSGFANYIYNLYGYTMERVAQNIYNTNGTYVSWDQLQPGDLLFFGSSAYSVGHVGIYVGNGQMVHASTYTTGVILSDLGGYYTNSFVGGKRLIG